MEQIYTTANDRNAIKLGPTGSAIIVRLDKKSSIPIAVRDHSIGIKEKRNRWRTAFWVRVAISKQIITTHSGKIWPKSLP